MSASRIGTAAALAVLLPACIASSPAPKAWQRSLDDVQRVSYGAWTRVQGPSLVIDGELIAVEPTRLLLARGNQAAVIPSTCVEHMWVAAFEAPGTVAAWGGVGALSTISHGFFLVFSLPTWVVTSAVSTYQQTSQGHIENRKNSQASLDSQALRKWARFPQGAPAGYLEQASEVQTMGASCASLVFRPQPNAGTRP
jgi:hypothetical protein